MQQLIPGRAERRWRAASVAAACAALALPAALAAQEGSAGDGPWTLGAYAGVLRIDDGELSGVGMEIDSPVLVLGGRAAYRFSERWEIEGGYGYASLTATSEPETGEVDGQLHQYHGALVYLVPAGRARFRLTGGVGGMRYSYDPFMRRNDQGEVVELEDTSWGHELVVLLGAGLGVDAGERFELRADVLDRVQFCNGEGKPINETGDFSHCPLDSAVLSNLELTGGIAFRF